MKKLWGYLKAYRKECVLAPLFKMLEASFELLVPLVVAAMIDTGIAAGDKTYIMHMCLLLVALGVVGLASSISAQYFAAKASVGFAAKLRHALLDSIQRLSYGQMDTLGASTMMTRMTSDVNQLQNGVNLALRLLLRSPFVVFGAMLMAFTIDLQAALIFAAVIPALCVVVFGIMLWTIPQYKKVQENLDSVTGAARENLSGVRVIRAFCMEEEENKEFERRNEKLTRLQQKVGKISALMNPVTYVLINVAVIALIWTGAIRVNSGALSQGQVVALYNYMSQILVELVKMANLIITMTKAAACGNRIGAVLSFKTDQLDGGLEPETRCGKVEFRNVSLRYPGSGAEALQNISFAAEPGQTIGIIGGTGSGKTSLVNLIPRFYDATEGSVLVDGVDVRQFQKNALRSRVGVAPQKAVLFRGTIRSNLLWGNPNATEAELQEALRVAQAEEIVRGKENGLEEPVAQGGGSLSGGQRQRLTIARALVRKPEILILDDSASALDYATDSRLRGAIASMKNRPTTFIVSQRAASVRFADLILVLDDGKIVDAGTHEALLARCEIYQEIYYSQFPKEAKSHG